MRSIAENWAGIDRQSSYQGSEAKLAVYIPDPALTLRGVGSLTSRDEVGETRDDGLGWIHVRLWAAQQSTARRRIRRWSEALLGEYRCWRTRRLPRKIKLGLLGCRARPKMKETSREGPGGRGRQRVLAGNSTRV